MSQRIKSTLNQVSNDDVVEELTQDLESQLQTHRLEGCAGTFEAEYSIKPGPSSVHAPTSGGDGTAPSLGDNAFEDVDLKKEEDSDSDSIDELALKDAEVELTEQQKTERQSQAEELKIKGNDVYKLGEYQSSIDMYTEGLKICPLQYPQQRAILYCNRSAAKMKLKMYDKAVKDCTKALELDEKYVKALIRRAQAYEELQKFDESLADFKKILELDPGNKEAFLAAARLPPLIEERNEKLKQEMFTTLKKFGNMVLKPFGLSTDNFQMEQDPETKGYKINFKQ